MNPETHLSLHRLRSTELRERAAEFRTARAAGPTGTRRPVRSSPRALRTRLGWILVELGLHILPGRESLTCRPPRTV
ncbi:hypothetical protein [Streptomyces sp. ML-6]|uniref:hypothetical protein n=1 Tax=Streptomyces sp. ML-6 TaxID=2982693 RepID=UPI0024BF7287|nr:hypothetical protein [Streptomyces sp. ML-6]MDK0519741.1 hypothetical protein [Streptomyces sp. ML-6]